MLVAPLFHWYAKLLGELFHVPVVDVSTLPNVVAPEITGAAVLTGA